MSERDTGSSKRRQANGQFRKGASGNPQGARLPDGPAPFTTLVELTFDKRRIEHWIRFGRKSYEQIIDRRRSVVGFAPGSVFAFVRMGADGSPALVVCNMTPVPREGYRIGVPRGGRWREILNTDANHYGGSGVGNFGGVDAVGEGSHGQPASLILTLPPLATLILSP